eukprot:Clim_evm11s214 gene=Clim_evmTU11s214
MWRQALLRRGNRALRSVQTRSVPWTLITQQWTRTCTSSTAKPTDRKQSKWQLPEGSPVGLKIYNSQTQTIEPFVVKNVDRISWYMCGPTVYDEAHLGHARTYVTFDILRRVISEFWRVNVVQVMGVTDVDEKVFKRAAATNRSMAEVAAQYEVSFMSALEKLGVQLPSRMVRVSEVIDEILAMTKKLVDRGLAYEIDGNILFDTQAYKEAGFRYGKFLDAEGHRPHQFEAPLQEKKVIEENLRHPDDFIIWRKAQQGEPSWESPWGDGRPGWHVECSVMASLGMLKMAEGTEDISLEDLAPDTADDKVVIDIHTGGADLKWPHHENEVATCEGALGRGQWVNYWMHTGHLLIGNRKMSKNLGNYITVDNFLKIYTASQFRMFCLMHKYRDDVDYTPQLMEKAVQTESRISEFLLTLFSHIRERFSQIDFMRRWTEEDMKLQKTVYRVRSEMAESLSNDIDTPRVVQCMLELIDATEAYLSDDRLDAQPELLTSIISFTAHFLDLFGFKLKTEWTALDFDSDRKDERIDISREDNPVIDAFVGFRTELRLLADSTNDKTLKDLTDKLRMDLLHFGIRIEDQGTKALWKLARTRTTPEQMSKDLLTFLSRKDR